MCEPRRRAGESDAESLAAEGIWPRTNRVLPWLAAAFLAMVWLVPFDSITAPFSVGVDSKLDRLVLVLLVGVWIIIAAGGRRYRPRFRRSPLNVAILLFVVAVIASIIVRLPVLSNLDEVNLSIKQLAVLLSYITLFYFVATVIRQGEVENLLKFMVILACLTAVGTIWEYRSQTDLFYVWAAKLFHGFTVGTPPPASFGGRPSVVGPTQTSLADAAILSIALSFALVFLFHAERRPQKLLWYVAAGLLLAGTVSTQRKSAVLIPIGTLVVLAAYRPRQMLRFMPAFFVLILAIYVVSPHAISGLRYQFTTATTSGSTMHRTSAYAGVTPFILANPLLGRGYGSYNPNVYGILDDQYLGLLIESGFLGLAAFVGLLVTGATLAHKAVRSRNPALVPQGLALMGALVGFAVACATFDVLAFPQVPYLLMFVLALAVVSADGARHAEAAQANASWAR